MVRISRLLKRSMIVTTSASSWLSCGRELWIVETSDRHLVRAHRLNLVRPPLQLRRALHCAGLSTTPAAVIPTNMQLALG